LGEGFLAETYSPAQLALMNIFFSDTGPLVALLDRSEPDHDRVQSFMARLRGSRLVTTGAVITEAFYFLSDVRDGPALSLHSWMPAPPKSVMSLTLRHSPLQFV